MAGNKEKKTWDSRQIVVIGGGASGLMAAIMAARAGARVTVLEHKDQLGKKILSTGNGRCNLGNRRMERDCYHSGIPEFPWKVFRQFGLEENQAFWEELGMVLRDKNGYLYPWSESAAAVAELLRDTVEKLGAETILGCHVKGCRREWIPTTFRGSSGERSEKQVWRVQTDQGDFIAEKVILAAGSKAASVLGSDGSGYAIAEQAGHSVVNVLPALVQLRCQGTFFKVWSGVRVEAQVRLFLDGVIAASDRGEVQLTDYGISGIPVFQVSRFASIGLADGKKVEVFLDFLPFLDSDVERNREAKREWLRRRLEQHADRTAETFFTGVFHKKLALVLLRCAGIRPEQQIASLEKTQIEKLETVLTAFRLTVTQTNSFEQAQICCGGVDVREVDWSTMESKKAEGLYLVGELLDVDGICGGYNLQWAFSSGAVAGRAAAESLKSVTGNM